MRLLMSPVLLSGLFLLSVPLLPPPLGSAAFAQECSGENCPPPQGGSGRDCESKKQEDQVS